MKFLNYKDVPYVLQKTSIKTSLSQNDNFRDIVSFEVNNRTSTLRVLRTFFNPKRENA